MRDREVIDSVIRLLAAVRRSIREHGGEPSSRRVDELLDERLAHRGPGPASMPQSARSGAPSLYKGNYQTSRCQFVLARCHGPNGTCNMLM
jgi:hypothetical protein